MPCAGRCDEPIPVLIGNEQWVGDAKGNLTRKATPIPPINPGRIEECVFSQIREPERNTLAGYKKTGGYEGLTRAIKEMNSQSVIEHVKASKQMFQHIVWRNRPSTVPSDRFILQSLGWCQDITIDSCSWVPFR